MLPIRDCRYERRRDINQFGYKSFAIYPGPNNADNCSDSQQTVWFHPAQGQYEVVTSYPLNNDTEHSVELTRIKMKATIAALNTDPASTFPCNFPGKVHWVMFICKQNDEFTTQGNRKLRRTRLSSANEGSSWMCNLFVEQGPPELEQIIDFGVVSINPQTTRFDTWDIVPYSYDINQNPDTGVGIITPIVASGVNNFFGGQYSGGDRTAKEIKVDHVFNIPQKVARDAQIRIWWSTTVETVDPAWWTAFCAMWDAPQFCADIEGLIEVEYRT